MYFFTQEYTDSLYTSQGLTNPNGKLTMGSSAAVEGTKDPSYHIYRGLTFNSGRFATLKSNLTSSELLIAYWVYKHTSVDTNFQTYQHKTSSGFELISINHITRGISEYYQLQVCVNYYCLFDKGNYASTTVNQNYVYLSTKKWHFIAVAIS